MNNQEFSPFNAVERALSRWWLMIALMVIGALIGWIFHLFLPEEYDASASITINIDFSKFKLTQIEEDTAFNAAGAVITSTAVENFVIADARDKGILISHAQFQRYFYLEGRQSAWELRVRDKDPNAAAALASIWAQRSTDALNAALAHAVQADEIQVQLAGLENCLLGVVPPVGSPQIACGGLSQEDLHTQLNNQSVAFVKEKQSSLGILSIMSISLTTLAVAPSTPVIYGQAGLVLAGAFLGFLISLLVVNTIRVSHHD